VKPFFVEVEVNGNRSIFRFKSQELRNKFMKISDIFDSIKIVRFGSGVWE